MPPKSRASKGKGKATAKASSSSKKISKLTAATKDLSIKNPSNARFKIVRLIQYTNKAPPTETTGHTFESGRGDDRFEPEDGEFLLDLSMPQTQTPRVRTPTNKEGVVPRRILQSIHLPWGLPQDIIDDNGDALPLRILDKDRTYAQTKAKRPRGVVAKDVAFELGERVMLVSIERQNEDDEEGDLVKIVDFEGKAGTVRRRDLYEDDEWNEVPWGVYVDTDAIQTVWGGRTGPKYIGEGVELPDEDEDEEEEEEEEEEEGKDEDVEMGEGSGKKKVVVSTPSKGKGKEATPVAKSTQKRAPDEGEAESSATAAKRGRRS